MNLDELRTVQRTERRKDSLQHLRESFYEDVAAHIADLKRERKRAAAEADDPFASPEVRRLTDEIQTAEELVEAIYERRVGKVVKRASFAAADMSTREEGLTTEERNLFSDLVDRIKRNRETVLAALAVESDSGGVDAPAPATPADETPDSDPTAGDARSDTETSPDARRGRSGATDRASTDPTPPGSEAGASTPDATDVLADAMGGGESEGAQTPSVGDDGAAPSPGDERDAPEPKRATGDAPNEDAAAGAADPRETGADGDDASAGRPNAPGADASAGKNSELDTERVTLRITRDIGSILGVDDREYDLEREDVVRLPAANAGPLVERDAAERLD